MKVNFQGPENDSLTAQRTEGKMPLITLRDARAIDCEVQGSDSSLLVDHWEEFPPNEGESGAVGMCTPLTLDPQPRQKTDNWLDWAAPSSQHMRPLKNIHSV